MTAAGHNFEEKLVLVPLYPTKIHTVLMTTEKLWTI